MSNLTLPLNESVATDVDEFVIGPESSWLRKHTLTTL
jgi:hypothetical protein